MTVDLVHRLKLELKGTPRKRMKPLPAPESLVQRVYDISSPPPTISDGARFGRIVEVVDGITAVTHQFDTLKKAESNAVYRAGLQVVDFARQAIGKSPLTTTYSALFLRNIQQMDVLCALADDIFKHSELEYHHLKGVVDRSLVRRQKAFASRTKVQEALPDILTRYEQVQKSLQGMRKGDTKDGKDFFALQRERLELERHVDILGKGAYPLAIDQELSEDRTGDFYEHMERLFRLAYITAQRITDGSKRINEALRNTHRAYSQFDDLYGASAACSRGLASLSGFHERLTADFTEGMHGLVGILHQDEQFQFLQGTNSRFGHLIADIERLESGRNYRNELLLQPHETS